MTVTVTRRIEAPVERVWALATDLSTAPEVLSGVDSVELLAGGESFGVGTRWRETRTLYGRTATEEMWVTAVDVPRSYTVEAESRGMRYASTFSFAPDGSDGAATRVTLTFDARPLNLVSRFLAATLGRVMTGTVAKALTQDVADLAAAAER